ncbi:MAG: hypothetical protein ONB43_27270 [candidate division KSB1 bacterium]|nr:hypothetical protein [candidate division KSB1 bacterium]
MELPNRDKAYIPPSKLKDYLLSETHIVGKSKARFLRAFGFDETNVDLLEQGLLTIAQTQEVNEVVSSPHGKKYVIDGSLETPIGNFINMRTVWIMDKGQNRPRFVTAIPN